MIKKIVNVLRTWWMHRTDPLRLEFVVTDYCNLNCKGCTHYAPLAPREFADFDTLRASVRHLGRVTGGKVPNAYLIGGEPLLYPQLTDAMKALRESFPKSKLYIFTNGLALPKMNEEFWQLARELDFIIALTRYPIQFDYDAVERLIADHGVECRVFGDRSLANSFYRFGLDPKGGQNPRIAHFKCANFGCLSVIGDRLYPCSISGCVGHLNKACGTDYRHLPGDWLDVPKITGIRQIKALRDKPVPFCRHCILPPAVVEYGPSRREASEWTQAEC